MPNTTQSNGNLPWSLNLFWSQLQIVAIKFVLFASTTGMKATFHLLSPNQCKHKSFWPKPRKNQGIIVPLLPEGGRMGRPWTCSLVLITSSGHTNVAAIIPTKEKSERNQWTNQLIPSQTEPLNHQESHPQRRRRKHCRRDPACSGRGSGSPPPWRDLDRSLVTNHGHGAEHYKKKEKKAERNGIDQLLSIYGGFLDEDEEWGDDDGGKHWIFPFISRFLSFLKNTYFNFRGGWERRKMEEERTEWGRRRRLLFLHLRKWTK